MIESLNAWVRNILMLVLCITFMEMLLPKGNIAKFARFTFGLLIIASIVDPILSITGDISKFQIDLFVKETYHIDYGEMERQWDDMVITNYKEKLKAQIETIVCSIDEIDDANVRLVVGTDGGIEEVYIDAKVTGAKKGQTTLSSHTQINIPSIPTISVGSVGSKNAKEQSIDHDIANEDNPISTAIREKITRHLDVPIDRLNVNINP